MPIKLMALAFCVLFSILNLHGQKPYAVKWKSELAVGSAGAGLWVTSYVFSRSVDPITEEIVLNLDPGSINAFDRWSLNRSSNSSLKASNYILYGAYALPVVLLAGKATRDDFGTVLILYGETMLLTAGLTLFSKLATQRYRPITYNPDVSLEERQLNNNKFSFFSGHVSETAASCFFTAKVFSDYFPESPARPYIWAGAALIPATSAFLRMNAGKHFPTDVIAGYAVGAATGFLVPHLHKKKRSKTDKQELTFFPLPGGAYLQLSF